MFTVYNSPSADKAVIAKAAKRIHLLNHPDKGRFIHILKLSFV